MRVSVLYFATLRDRAGVKDEPFECPSGTTVKEFKELLGQKRSELVPALDTALVAVNREFAFPDHVLQEGDDVALFPPVSGGGPVTVTRITRDPVDLNHLLNELIQPTTGAACVFTGVVRARTERDAPHDTAQLTYEAYIPMAEEKMGQVAAEIRERWPSVEAIAIVQRIGDLAPGTPTVMIACTAAHRDSGVFEAARYGIDRLKQIVPIWKKEIGPGGEAWVEGDYKPTPQDRRS